MANGTTATQLTLHKTFGPNQFLDAVAFCGYSNWSRMAEGGFMDYSTRLQIKSFAEKFKKRYPEIFSDGNYENLQADYERYLANFSVARFDRSAASSPVSVVVDSFFGNYFHHPAAVDVDDENISLINEW
ncbi:hypothetical protein ACHAWC_010294 [Mediolabrus comicus]